MGFPLLFNGNFTTESGRPSLSVTVTGVDDPGYSASDLSQSQGHYFESRKKWLESRNGFFKKEIPFKEYFSKNKSKIFSIGFEYILNDKYFIEQTFFYFCPSSMVHLKLLMNEAHRKFIPEINKTIENATCKKSTPSK